MSSVLAAILLLIAIYYSISDPIKFLFVYGVTAAYNEARGVEGFLSSGFIPYVTIMQYILFFVLLRCIFKRNSILKSDRWILMCVMAYILWVGFSCAIGGHILSIPLYVAQNCPVYILVLYAYRDKVEIGGFIIKLLTFYVLLAFLIIYLPVIGIGILEPLQGYKYLDTSYTMGSPATLTNFYKVFSYKYQFNLSAQFHNPNDTAVVGAIGIACYSKLFMKKKKIKWLILSVISAILWINGGSRAAILGLAIAIVASIMMARNDSKKMLILLVTTAVITLVLASDGVTSAILSELSSTDYGSIYVSINSRQGLRASSIELIKQAPLFGSGGALGGISVGNTTITQYAHELPLRQAAMFGIPAGVLSVMLLYVIPLLRILRNKKYHFITFSCYFIMLISTMANGLLLPFIVYLMVYSCAFLDDSSWLVERVKFINIRFNRHRKIRSIM